MFKFSNGLTTERVSVAIAVLSLVMSCTAIWQTGQQAERTNLQYQTQYAPQLRKEYLSYHAQFYATREIVANASSAVTAILNDRPDRTVLQTAVNAVPTTFFKATLLTPETSRALAYISPLRSVAEANAEPLGSLSVTAQTLMLETVILSTVVLDEIGSANDIFMPAGVNGIDLGRPELPLIQLLNDRLSATLASLDAQLVQIKGTLESLGGGDIANLMVLERAKKKQRQAASLVSALTSSSDKEAVAAAFGATGFTPAMASTLLQSGYLPRTLAGTGSKNSSIVLTPINSSDTNADEIFKAWKSSVDTPWTEYTGMNASKGSRYKSEEFSRNYQEAPSLTSGFNNSISSIISGDEQNPPGAVPSKASP